LTHPATSNAAIQRRLPSCIHTEHTQRCCTATAWQPFEESANTDGGVSQATDMRAASLQKESSGARVPPSCSSAASPRRVTTEIQLIQSHNRYQLRGLNASEAPDNLRTHIRDTLFAKNLSPQPCRMIESSGRMPMKDLDDRFSVGRTQKASLPVVHFSRRFHEAFGTSRPSLNFSGQ